MITNNATRQRQTNLLAPPTTTGRTGASWPDDPARRHLTIPPPWRSYPALPGRLLHDQTADKIARVVSRIPRSAATIIPFDEQARLEVLAERQAIRKARVPVPDGDWPRARPAGHAAGGHADRRRHPQRQGHGGGPGPQHRDQAGGTQLRARLPGH